MNFTVVYHFDQKEWRLKKSKKLVANLYDKTETENWIHIRILKQALDHELALKKLHRITKLKQKAWLKSYIDMNTGLRGKSWIIMQFLVKPPKMWENIAILNLP